MNEYSWLENSSCSPGNRFDSTSSFMVHVQGRTKGGPLWHPCIFFGWLLVSIKGMYTREKGHDFPHVTYQVA